MNQLDMSKVKVFDFSFPITPMEKEPDYEMIAEGVCEETLVWPLIKCHSYADDSYCQYIKMKSHVGAHIEAPWHHDAKGATLDMFEPEQFFGRMVFMNFDLPEGCKAITREMFEKEDNGRIREGDIVFCHCKNVVTPEGMDARPIDLYTKLDTPVLAFECGEYLVEKGVKLLGTDHTVSMIASVDGKQWVHDYVLEHNMPVIEMMKDLKVLSEPVSFAIAIPGLMKIKGLDSCTTQIVVLEGIEML